MEDSTSSSGRTDPRDAKPRLTGGSPSGFTLDTSGRVAGDLDGLSVWYEFDDLSPLARGYIEALFADLHRQLVAHLDGEPEPWPNWSRPRFSDLAPETLARIIADCERFLRLHPTTLDLKGLARVRGAEFWRLRNVPYPTGSGLRVAFPPLKVALADDGRVYLRAPSLNPEAE